MNGTMIVSLLILAAFLVFGGLWSLSGYLARLLAMQQRETSNGSDVGHGALSTSSESE